LKEDDNGILTLDYAYNILHGDLYRDIGSEFKMLCNTKTIPKAHLLGWKV